MPHTSTMPRTHWNQSYSVGVTALDNHHEHLLKLINQLSEYSAHSVHSEEIVDTISELVQYVMYHFEYEERLMAQHSFPGLSRHRDEHRQFCQVIAEVSFGVSIGLIDTLYLLEYLEAWWKNHILLEDMQYKPFLAIQATA